MRTSFVVMVVLLVCGTLAAAENSGNGSCCAAGGMTMRVGGRDAVSRAAAGATIIDFAFTSNVVVNTGDTVTWTNTGTETHTVSSDTGIFDSGSLDHGSTFSFTFAALGAFPYHCSIHPRMKSQIRVVSPGTVAINSELTAVGMAGAPFTYTITSLGAVPFTFGATGLPPGLSLSGATISGTPTVAGTTQVALTANNSAGGDAQTLTVIIQPGTVSAPAAPVITSPLQVTGKAGQAFSYTITASGNPTNFAATGLPSGLALSGAQISGVPAIEGQFAVPISASNALGADNQILNLAILSAASSNSGIDANGNGIPDELESALNLTALPGATQTLNLTALTIGLKFSDGDTIALSGQFPATSLAALKNAKVTVDVGGVVRTFQLDAKGAASSGSDTLKVSSKTGKFACKIKGSLASLLADENLTQAKVKNAATQVPVFVFFDALLFSTTANVNYTSSGKSGHGIRKK